MENTKEVARLGNHWKTLPQDVIFHIFSWLDLATIVRMSGLNSTWKTLTSDNKCWQPIVLKHISPPETEPTSWKALFNSHQLALSNLQSGKYGLLPQQQEKVDAVFSYGDEPDKVPNHLVLIKEDGKKVQQWDLEGNPKTLWTSDTPLTPTEVMWGEEGPELMLFSKNTFEWVLLRLNDTTKNVSGKERSWAPKDLSEQYLSVARGNRIGVWDDLSTTRAQFSLPPIPLQTTNGVSYFILHRLGKLRVNTQDGNGKILSQKDWADTGPSSFLRVQPTTNGPTYLAGINRAEEFITLWNTETWQAEESRLQNYAPHGNYYAEVQYFKSGGHYYLTSSQNFNYWLSEFDPKTGEFIGKTQLLRGIPNHPITLSMYQVNLILGLQKHVLRHIIDQTPGCLSVWSINPGNNPPLTLGKKFDMPTLEGAALCTDSNGQLTLPYLAGGELQVIDLQQNLTQLPKYSTTRNTFRAFGSLPRSDSLFIGMLLGGFLIATIIGGIVTYKASKAIWRALPSLRARTSLPL